MSYFYLNPKLKIPSGFPIWFLIGNNILPICGLLFFGWTIFDMMIFLIMETLVLGIFTIIKIACIKNEIIKPTKRLVTKQTLSFFGNNKTTTGEVITSDPIKIKIYTIFVTFITLMVGLGICTAMIFDEFNLHFNINMLFFGIMPLLSHFVSFTKNYVLKNEFLYIQPDEFLSNFILRIMPMMWIMGLGVLFGKLALLFFILIFKTIIDYRRHIKEHSVIYSK